MRFDRAIFTFGYWAGQIFTAIFIIAVALGISRTLLMGTLALLQSRKESEREAEFAAAQAANPDSRYTPQVSVVIAAYNEAKVVNSTIATLLAGDYPNLEIVVVDDGSKDDTAEVVRAKYGGDSRLTILSKPNGGKASALNLGIKECQGEIVVALDADTVFAPDTISRLVRHFADPTIGAVSGNVKVGNRRKRPSPPGKPWSTSPARTLTAVPSTLSTASPSFPAQSAHGAKDAIILAGLYSSATLAEDTDLTFKVRRLGYKIVTDSTALAYTEAPTPSTTSPSSASAGPSAHCNACGNTATPSSSQNGGTFGMVAMPSLWNLPDRLPGYRAHCRYHDPLVFALQPLYHAYIRQPQHHHARVLLAGVLGRGANRRGHRFPPRQREHAPARLAAPPALRLPTDHVLRDRQIHLGRRPRLHCRLGQTRAQRHQHPPAPANSHRAAIQEPSRCRRFNPAIHRAARRGAATVIGTEPALPISSYRELSVIRVLIAILKGRRERYCEAHL